MAASGMAGRRAADRGPPIKGMHRSRACTDRGHAPIKGMHRSRACTESMVGMSSELICRSTSSAISSIVIWT